MISARLTVNDEEREIAFRPSDTLLFVLRERLGLTGAKPGCLNGDCGACTVNVNGTAMKSCLMLAVEGMNQTIRTIEGLKDSPIQHAFIEHFAFQCGYCTPGFIMNINSLLKKHPNADDSTIKEFLSSNICRCTGYQEIEKAVKSLLKINREDKAGLPNDE
ncbi:(2Fe-2S)-binding protein [Fictibacillus enclensis]|uniref:(2Fe-2S)-binding protein n=1 Tax=Fictibacillus enclensis TaxID=1017270 RepID=UPI0024BF7840|nr:(2Fe-2S)-binding protein [Fictibacillus enclensis]MDM5339589.1 (2Fe-2S)-binding protein [Fictibacillus enclensis]WHY71019.1 (2Fe-2S)-binding protein [Fictibacillus enclensis]